MGIKKGEEYYLEVFSKVHNNKYTYPEFTYKNNEDKIDIICPTHGMFKQIISNHASGKGCQKCARELVGLKRKSKIENLLKVFKNVHSDLYSYDKFTEYKGTHDKIGIFCKKHNEYFYQSVNSHKRGSGCPKCGKEKSDLAKSKTHENFIEDVVVLWGDKWDLSKVKYTGSNDKVTIGCEKHGYFKISPNNLLSGKGCKNCAIEQLQSNTEDFINKSKKIHGDVFDYSKVEYVNSVTPVTIICKSHGEFSQIANGHLNGNGCKHCTNFVSKPEQELTEILKKYFTDVQQSNRSVLEGKELDIFIPSKSIAIEYNGLYWHSDTYKDKNYHLLKLNLCKDKGITLIQIFEDEWLSKREIVISRIFNILGITENTVYARKCKVKEVDSKTATNFLEINHIQGKVGSKNRLGLYYNNELVSLMTFGELRKNLGSVKTENVYELLRFCNKLNTNVVGGASKLLKYFEDTFSPEGIVSYADLRWSQGDLYNKLNFEFVHQSEPNYFYTKGLSRENRFKYRKSELVKQGYDINKTEKEIMNELGFSRIYDAGTLKFFKQKNGKKERNRKN